MKRPVPKRLCKDPQTKYCTGHKTEHNAGWPAECDPYLLPERIAELKRWWEENDMGPWEDE